ncbi:unnamed protein product [Vitrella brassicaformis CCMP3155]|uniref:Autophagy-related protein 13 N-terminal domain-containing protein n=5 Tax=Vitrella brassicaformis TaxID=1169539 RepID=A0A0G4ES87_VITBC|nr:unnamed protein product [Vitrella brassicaformis CCMP3155]|eukprot:CEM00772.1 unnamed protein product [Vitrella brassicaformis CCMP3155]
MSVPRKQVEGWLAEFLIKASEVILQARVIPLKTSSHPRHMSTLFQLRLAEWFDVRQEVARGIRGYHFDRPFTFSVEIYLNKTDADGRPGDQLLVERWTFKFHPNTLAEKYSDRLYNKLCLGLRTLLCFTRLLPAYHCYVDAQRGAHATSRAPGRKDGMATARLSHRVHFRDINALANYNCKEVTSSDFLNLPCSFGVLSVGVSHRLELPFPQKPLTEDAAASAFGYVDNYEVEEGYVTCNPPTHQPRGQSPSISLSPRPALGASSHHHHQHHHQHRSWGHHHHQQAERGWTMNVLTGEGRRHKSGSDDGDVPPLPSGPSDSSTGNMMAAGTPPFAQPRHLHHRPTGISPSSGPGVAPMSISPRDHGLLGRGNTPPNVTLPPPLLRDTSQTPTPTPSSAHTPWGTTQHMRTSPRVGTKASDYSPGRGEGLPPRPHTPHSRGSAPQTPTSRQGSGGYGQGVFGPLGTPPLGYQSRTTSRDCPSPVLGVSPTSEMLPSPRPDEGFGDLWMASHPAVRKQSSASLMSVGRMSRKSSGSGACSATGAGSEGGHPVIFDDGEEEGEIFMLDQDKGEEEAFEDDEDSHVLASMIGQLGEGAGAFVIKKDDTSDWPPTAPLNLPSPAPASPSSSPPTPFSPLLQRLGFRPSPSPAPSPTPIPPSTWPWGRLVSRGSSDRRSIDRERLSRPVLHLLEVLCRAVEEGSNRGVPVDGRKVSDAAMRAVQYGGTNEGGVVQQVLNQSGGGRWQGGRMLVTLDLPGATQLLQDLRTSLYGYVHHQSVSKSSTPPASMRGLPAHPHPGSMFESCMDSSGDEKMIDEDSKTKRDRFLASVGDLMRHCQQPRPLAIAQQTIPVRELFRRLEHFEKLGEKIRSRPRDTF